MITKSLQRTRQKTIALKQDPVSTYSISSEANKRLQVTCCEFFILTQIITSELDLQVFFLFYFYQREKLVNLMKRENNIKKQYADE
jgi:hypothetical protein